MKLQEEGHYGETTKIYEQAKEIVEQYLERADELRLVNKNIAEILKSRFVLMFCLVLHNLGQVYCLKRESM